jgi:hypothetical protein
MSLTKDGYLSRRRILEDGVRRLVHLWIDFAVPFLWYPLETDSPPALRAMRT